MQTVPRSANRIFWPGLLLAACGCAALWAQAGAAGAFDKIKALEGEWTGKTSSGMAVTSNFRTTSAGSAVIQMLGEGVDHEMPTVYHMDGDRLMMTHYCSAKNQPRMVLAPGQESAKTMKFDFLDVTNLSGPDAGHMRHVVFTFIDKDHFRQDWTYREKGKDSTDVFDFVRKR